MTNLEKIAALLAEVKNKTIAINPETDLFEEKILDSLDSMVFFMLFEEKYGISVSQKADLKAEGYGKVSFLLELFEKSA